jgi:hypothetical protein
VCEREREREREAVDNNSTINKQEWRCVYLRI